MPHGVELFADLYEFRMARAYLELGMREEAVFSLAIRRLPAARNLLLACGTGDLLDLLEELRFGPDSLGYLHSLGEFPRRSCNGLRASASPARSMPYPDGMPVFAEEPILEIVAPIAEAQLIETLVMNQVGLQTLLASKAARIVAAAAGRPVVDFETAGRRGSTPRWPARAPSMSPASRPPRTCWRARATASP